MGKKQKAVITAGCFGGYFLFGFIDNMKGATLPAILEDMGFDHSTAGMIICSEYTGFFLATFLAGLLADLFGKKATLVLAGFCLILGVAGYASSFRLFLFVGFIFLIGLGLGALELGGSNFLSGLWGRRSGRYLNLLNACYGVGAIVTPVVAGHWLGLGISWRAVYRYSLFLILPITLYFIIMKVPREEKKDGRQEKVDGKELLAIILHKKVLFMYVVIFAYVAAEIGTATWFVEFLQKEKQMPASVSSICFSIYFVGMTVGRLLGSLFVDRVGHRRSLLIFTGISSLSLAVGIFGSGYVSFALIFTGFGFSIIFPTSTTVVSRIPSKNSGILLGSFFAFGGLGGMVGPYLIGVVNDFLGLKAGMAVNLVFCGMIAVALWMSVRDKKDMEVS